MSNQRDYNVHNAYEQAKASASASDTTGSWETLLGALKQHDGSAVDTWKDELNNLLIFAGLFSAVVTAFTVESYPWLQPDPSDVSTQLLAQISLQLSTLSVNVGYINSSAPPLTLSDAQTAVTKDFSPGPSVVTINVLWVLSLTVSLLASFFAIAVQQWLRHLPLPSKIALREQVRLQQYRYDGLQMWQVASIVSLLPLLLQVAVVLFLAGLLLLLLSLNHTVALAFAIVSGAGLSTFLITALVPLVSVRCPYKSPLIPTMATVLQWVTYPLSLIFCVVASAADAFCGTKVIENWMFRRGYWVTYRNTFHWRVERLKTYVRSFGSHMYVTVNDFWTRRELADLVRWDSDSLDRGALGRGLLSASSEAFEKMKTCLNDLTDSGRVSCVRNAVLSSLECDEGDIVSLVLGQSIPPVLTRIPSPLSNRHEDLLLAAFPLTLGPAQLDAFCMRHDIAHMLVILSFAMPAHHPTSPRRCFYGRLLFNLRKCQKLDRHSWWWTGRQVITTLLYEECSHLAFTRHEIRLVMSWALELLGFANRPDMEWVVEYSQLHTSSTVLASVATALTARAAVETLDGEDTAQLTRLLRSFACFLKKYRGAIAVCADQCLANPETSLLIVGPRAVVTICKHLVKLPSQGSLLGNRDLYNETQVLLSELCSERDEEPFVKARRHLRRLRAALVSPRNREMS